MLSMTNSPANYSDAYAQMNFSLSLLKLAANTAEEASATGPSRVEAVSSGMREVLWEDTREVESFVARMRTK